MIFIRVLLLSIFAYSIDCNIILKPSKLSGVQAGYVFVQGASIPAQNYQKYALELQDKFNGSLWVALTSFPLDTPEPVLIGQIMSSAFAQLKQAGFNYDSNTPVFFGGHSLGGIMVQNYLFDPNTKLPFSLRGLVLEGSFISRTNVDKFNKLDLPLLTLGAELDGLARITRIAESFEILTKKQNAHVFVIPGMNHYQFAGEGNPPPNVVKNDIAPEVTNEFARARVTSNIKAFFHYQLGISNNDDIDIFYQSVEFTDYTLNPLVEALKQEGFYHFVPPCSQDQNLKPPNCIIGSPWTPVSQLEMSSLNPASLIVTDSLRSVFQVPEHFPSINNKCVPNQQCVLNVSTYTDNVYTLIDGLDVGLDPIAATELRTKMQSRQSMLKAYTNTTFDFNETDAGNRCGEINQMALSYAIKNAPESVLKRYLGRGAQLKIGNDLGPYNNGFLWITNALKFDQKLDANNRTYFEVGAPTLRTPVDYSLKFVAGYHYCKLLSPARAMEFMYTDSLKPSAYSLHDHHAWDLFHWFDKQKHQ